MHTTHTDTSKVPKFEEFHVKNKDCHALRIDGDLVYGLGMEEFFISYVGLTCRTTLQIYWSC